MATIIFDFDDTLFDTALLKEDIFLEIISHGATKEQVLNSYKKCNEKFGNYTLKEHINILNNEYDLKISEDIFSWFESLNFTSYLFKETISSLEKLSEKHNLILLTKGDITFQKIKLEGVNILKYFKELFIVDGNKEVFLKDKYFTPPVYFINDKESENEKIQELFPEFIFILPDMKTGMHL